jgi:hypothetical protein
MAQGSGGSDTWITAIMSRFKVLGGVMRLCSQLVRAIVLVVVITTTAVPLRAIPHSAIDLADLVAQSDVVLVGRVLTLQASGSKVTVIIGGHPVELQPYAASVQVVRTLKGSVSKATIVVRYYEPNVDIGYQPLGVNLVGCFFLQAEVAGVFDIVNPRVPCAVALPPVPQSLGSSPLDKTLAEIRGAIFHSSTPIDVKEDAIRVLGEAVEFPGAAAGIDVLREVALNSSSPVSLHAVAVLLRRNDLTGLPAAVLALQSPSQMDEGLVIQLASSLHNGVVDSSALSSVATLRSSANIEVRRGAVGAMRNMACAEAVPFLVSALSDSDQEVRYDAMMGIASFAQLSGDHDDMAPTMDTFGLNEGLYLDYWRAWAASQ